MSGTGQPQLLVTLWPSFPHFDRFAADARLSGIRLNSAMITPAELREELVRLPGRHASVPSYFDVKGRQLRVMEVHTVDRHLELVLNHPIHVRTPCVVLFKAGEDRGLLERLEDGGRRLVFRGGPKYGIKAGESLHIRDSSLQMLGPTFLPHELEKIALVRAAGFTRYFLSYVEGQCDVDEFRELVGADAEIWLKIESKAGLRYVEETFRKTDGVTLVTARGDLFVEVDRPHDILAAQRLVVAKDPEACVGSRMLLSLVREPVPSATDLSELAWLYDIGYRRFLLCDELCLREEQLAPAVDVFDAFRDSYGRA